MDKTQAHKIIDDTANRYTLETRATHAPMGPAVNCVYLMDDGRKCAVGEYLTDAALVSSPLGGVHEVVNIAHFYLTGEESELADLTPVIDEHIFKPEARGLPLEFWERAQDLHDNCEFWDESGLTEAGKNKLKRIKEWIDAS